MNPDDIHARLRHDFKTLKQLRPDLQVVSRRLLILKSIIDNQSLEGGPIIQPIRQGQSDIIEIRIRRFRKSLARGRGVPKRGEARFGRTAERVRA